MKKILITGCAGHFGSVLTKHLLDKGYKVLGIDNLSYGGESMLSFYNDQNFQFYNIDITKKINKKFLNVDMVVHLAAYVSTLGSNKYPKLTNDINFKGSINLLKAYAKYKTPFIFASTCSNYGVSKGLVDETAELIPLGPYALSKVKVEKEILKKYKFAKILRFGTLAGASLRPRFDTMINEWVLESITNKNIICYAPNAYRPFVHVTDATNAIEVVIDKWMTLNSNVYNIASFNVTKKQLAVEISKITKCKLEFVNKGPDKRNYRVDSSNFKKATNFTFFKGLNHCIEEIKDLVKKEIIRDYNSFINFKNND